MMEQKNAPITNTCSFAGVEPVMMALPYPPIQVKEKNPAYANILAADYCGSVSEMTAIAQYINNENRLFCEKCPLAKSVLGLAMAEMIHLNMLGELIYLLGGTVDFAVRQRNGRQSLWTPAYLVIPDNAAKMLLADIDAEKAAIQQYRVHIKAIEDQYINDVLERIIKDEEYHIMVLQALREG